MSFCRQVAVPVQYKAVSLDCGYVLDLMIEDLVIVELKTVEKLLPIHEAQLLTYLRLLNKPVGLLLNFRESLLKSGLKRIVNNFSDSSASLRLGGSIAK